MDVITSLAAAPLGAPLTLMRSEGSPQMCRRLAALGLRRGAQIRLVNKTSGGGRVVQVAGARIALDRSMLDRLFVEPQAASVGREPQAASVGREPQAASVGREPQAASIR